MKPKSVIILECLLDGQPVKFPGDPNTYLYQDGIFGIEAKRYNRFKFGNDTCETEDVILSVDFTLPQFIEMCAKFSDDEIFIQGANLALKRINQLPKHKRIE